MTSLSRITDRNINTNSDFVTVRPRRLLVEPYKQLALVVKASSSWVPAWLEKAACSQCCYSVCWPQWGLAYDALTRDASDTRSTWRSNRKLQYPYRESPWCHICFAWQPLKTRLQEEHKQVSHRLLIHQSNMYHIKGDSCSLQTFLQRCWRGRGRTRNHSSKYWHPQSNPRAHCPSLSRVFLPLYVELQPQTLNNYSVKVEWSRESPNKTIAMKVSFIQLCLLSAETEG